MVHPLSRFFIPPVNVSQWVRSAAVVAIGWCMVSNAEPLADTPDDEAELDRRIAAVRQGDFVVHLLNTEGLPVRASAAYTLVRHEFPFGTAVSAKWLLADPDERADARHYQDTLSRTFNHAVAENAHKWYAMEPQSGEQRGPDATALAVWEKCRDLGLTMRGHCVLWGNPDFVQPWLKDLSAPDLEHAIRVRIKHVLELFEGKINEWDLNNEMMHGDYFARILNLTNAAPYFRWAQSVAPGNTYYLNDFSALQGGGEAMYVAHVRELLRAGAAVGGIGEQAHFVGPIPSTSNLWASLEKLGQFNLPVTITEFDIRTRDEHVQAADTRRFYKTCFAHPAVHAILMWGFWENAHWIPEAALWRGDWSIKPNGEAFLELMDEWRTKGVAPTDARGAIHFRGFFGVYDIECAGSRVRVVLDKAGKREVTCTLPLRQDAE